MKFYKISAPKNEKGALCEFFKFSISFALYLAVFLIIDTLSPKCSKKSNRKYIPDVKFYAVLNVAGRIGLYIEKNPEN